MIRTKVAAALAAALLSACMGGQVVVQNDDHFVPVPTSFTIPADYVEPPDQQTYATANWSQREELWRLAYIGQLDQTQVCNVRLEGVRKWSDDQQRVYAPASGVVAASAPVSQ